MTTINSLNEEIRTAFIKSATWHGSLQEAESILKTYPHLTNSDVHIAAILGVDAIVKELLAANPANAVALSAPYGGNALVYLCLSKYLRLDKTKEDGFLKAATALLDAGADANSGFWTTGDFPEFETALYGAAGVAQNAPLTRLLLERGADPNDGEAVYHSPETYENDAMKLLVETGKLTAENLVMMLIRKHDFHDYDGAKYLLEKGGNPNGDAGRGWYPLHHALARNNGIEIITLLFDHGTDPNITKNGLTGTAKAARQGRRDVLELIRERGFSIELEGVDGLIAACAMGDSEKIKSVTSQQPYLVSELIAMGGSLLSHFSGIGNMVGVAQLLNLGINVNAPFTEGDGYFGIPKGSLAIHVAAWMGRPEVVKLLIENGSPVDTSDGNGCTPLALAIRACVNSYWTYRRSPDAVEALLAAGASPKGIDLPSGYNAIDAVIAKYL